MFGKLKNGALFVLILLLLQEITFRALFPVPELSNFDRSNYIAGAEKGNNYSFFRNSKWYWESELDTAHLFVHELNQYGFRDKEWSIKKKDHQQRILFIGDSFLEGIMAEQNQTITEGFQLSDKENQFDIMNAGIMGTGFPSYFQLMSDAIPIFQPDLVCLVLYSNDFSSKDLKLPYANFQANYHHPFTPRLLEIIHQQQNGSPLLSRLNWKTNAFLPSIMDKNFPWNNREEVLVKNTSAKVKNSITNGTTNPFKVNQILREKEGLLRQPNLAPLFAFIQEMRANTSSKFVICYIPARHQVSNYYYQFDQHFCSTQCPDSLDLTTSEYNQHQNILNSYCKQYRIPYIDFTEEVKLKEDNNEHLYWKYDEHMKGSSYVMLGKQLFHRISTFSNE